MESVGDDIIGAPFSYQLLDIGAGLGGIYLIFPAQAIDECVGVEFSAVDALPEVRRCFVENVDVGEICVFGTCIHYHVMASDFAEPMVRVDSHQLVSEFFA